MQLVGPHVTLWDTMRDRRIGVREVKERFGVEPAALVDIQALTGDTIDNVKGVPGVGEKTAAALVQKFGGVKEIYENLDRVGESGIRGAKKIAALLGEHRAAVGRPGAAIGPHRHQVPLDAQARRRRIRVARRGRARGCRTDARAGVPFDPARYRRRKRNFPAWNRNRSRPPPSPGRFLGSLRLSRRRTAHRVLPRHRRGRSGPVAAASSDQRIVVEHDGIAGAPPILAPSARSDVPRLKSQIPRSSAMELRSKASISTRCWQPF